MTTDNPQWVYNEKRKAADRARKLPSKPIAGGGGTFNVQNVNKQLDRGGTTAGGVRTGTPRSGSGG